MENECEALPGVAYPGVRDNQTSLNTKIGYDDDDDHQVVQMSKRRIVFADNQRSGRVNTKHHKGPQGIMGTTRNHNQSP